MKEDAIQISADDGKMIRGTVAHPFNLSNITIKPVLMIFCHGFPESHMSAYDNLFGKLQNVCAGLGLASIRFDFRGCGKSDGSAEDFTIQSAVEDLELIYKWAGDHSYERFMVTAEGLGTIPILLNLHENIEAGTFFWPVFQPKDYAIRNLGIHTDKNVLDQETKIDKENNQTGLKLVHELSRMDLEDAMHEVKFPCLIQQGARDEKVPIEFLDLPRAHFRNRRIEMTSYQDGTHGLSQPNHRKYLMYHYGQFIQKYI